MHLGPDAARERVRLLDGASAGLLTTHESSSGISAGHLDPSHTVRAWAPRPYEAHVWLASACSVADASDMDAADDDADSASGDDDDDDDDDDVCPDAWTSETGAACCDASRHCCDGHALGSLTEELVAVGGARAHRIQRPLRSACGSQAPPHRTVSASARFLATEESAKDGTGRLCACCLAEQPNSPDASAAAYHRLCWH